MGKLFPAYKRRILAIVVVFLCGVCFLGAYSLRSKSMDYSFRFRSLFAQRRARSPDDVRIVFVDVTVITNAEPYVRLLKNLTDWEAKAVVFDIVFTNAFWNTTNSEGQF